MLLFILMPLLLLVGLPLLMLRLGVLAALGAKRLAARQPPADYLTAEVLAATFEAEPEGIWPPKPIDAAGSEGVNSTR